jgi:hypothetical protein
MSELLDLAARLIELEGGAAEPHPNGLAALLPSPLSAAWNVADELLLSESADPQPALETGTTTRLAYGTQLLERVLQHATDCVLIAHARLETTPVRANQVQRAGEQWGLRNGVTELGDVRFGRQTRIWVDALATLHGDEKRELLVSSIMSSHTGTQVGGFAELACELSQAGSEEVWTPAWSLVERALAGCLAQAEAAASGFRTAMTRRFERDRERIEGYFDDLLHELNKRSTKLDAATVADKKAAIMADRATKLELLSARFALRIEVLPITLRTVHVHGAFIGLKLRRRKATRTLELEYDAATRRLVPPQCESCLGPAIRPAACDDVLHLLCERCAPRAEGRLACAACATGKRAASLAG